MKKKAERAEKQVKIGVRAEARARTRDVARDRLERGRESRYRDIKKVRVFSFLINTLYKRTLEKNQSSVFAACKRSGIRK